MLVDAVADENAVLTVLAPTNSAFAEVNSEALLELVSDKEALTEVRSHLSSYCQAFESCY